MVANDPPQADDFISYFELYPGKEWSDPIAARALSVFTDDEDIVRLKRRVSTFRKRIKLKAVANLTPPCGKMANSPGNYASHHDWWKPTDTDPLTLFGVVAGEG